MSRRLLNLMPVMFILRSPSPQGGLAKRSPPLNNPQTADYAAGSLFG
jgi:hypothetical protein